jgi:hypothetical protein
MHFVRLDHLHDLRCARILFRIENVDAGGAQSRHDEISPLHMRMRRVGTKRGAARIPPEVVQLVARVRHRRAVDKLAIRGGLRVEIDDAERIGFRALDVEDGHVGKLLGRSLHRHSGGRVERRVRCPGCHGASVAAGARACRKEVSAPAAVDQSLCAEWDSSREGFKPDGVRIRAAFRAGHCKVDRRSGVSLHWGRLQVHRHRERCNPSASSGMRRGSENGIARPACADARGWDGARWTRWGALGGGGSSPPPCQASSSFIAKSPRSNAASTSFAWAT